MSRLKPDAKKPVRHQVAIGSTLGAAPGDLRHDCDKGGKGEVS